MLKGRGSLDDGDCSIVESTDGDSDFNGNSKIRSETTGFPTMIAKLVECGNEQRRACLYLEHDTAKDGLP